jgi:septation ring formation regulator EzrA
MLRVTSKVFTKGFALESAHEILQSRRFGKEKANSVVNEARNSTGALEHKLGNCVGFLALTNDILAYQNRFDVQRLQGIQQNAQGI